MARDFSPSQLSVQTLTQCPCSPCGQSHASSSVRTSIPSCVHVKNPQTLAAMPLFGHNEILQTLIRMGSAALVAAVPYPGKATQISCERH